MVRKVPLLLWPINCDLTFPRFKCGHCTVSMNSEQLLLQHCRVAHPNLPEVTVENTNKVVLDDHFWEQEYGLKRGKDSMVPPISSAVSPTSSVAAPTSSVDPSTVTSNLKKCPYCNYQTSLTTTLKRHEMRHWVQKPFECGYCKYNGLADFYVRRHCEKVHPDLPIKVIENSMPSKPDIKPLTRTRKSTHNEAQEGENNDDAQEGENNHDVETLDEEVRDPESATKEPSILYRCFYCCLKSVKLSYIHAHWQNKHRNEANSVPFRYKAIPISQGILGKDSGDEDEDIIQKFCCAYCKFKGPMSKLNSHFTEWHPGKDFKILDLKQSSFRCIHCSYVSIYLHILKEHIESEHSGLEFGYQVFHKSKTVRALGENSMQIPTASSKFQCLWCQEMCENKEKMDLHNTCFHSHLEPKFKAVDSSEVVVDVSDEVAKPPSNKPQKAINPNRRLYLCPDCPNKTMTLRVMRAHVSKMHIKEYECPYCSIVLEDFRAAHMHMVVEHPGVDRSKNLIPKSKEKIDHKMLFVKREGDDDEKDPGIPEFCEINITDILSKSQSSSNDPQSPPLIPIIHSNPFRPEESPINEESSPPVKRRRCVAKKSTAKPAKNTARKSFPSSSWIPPLLMIESEPYSSTEEEESDDEGQSWYVHPSAREPLPSLSSMSHLRTELSVNSTSTIPVTVDKLAMLMNLVPQVIITDCM
jgi:hypothetical protein